MTTVKFHWQSTWIKKRFWYFHSLMNVNNYSFLNEHFFGMHQFSMHPTFLSRSMLKSALYSQKNLDYGIGFPFAKLLRNFWGTKHKFFLSLRISFARKNNNLRNHSQKSFCAKLPYSAFCKTQVLRNSATRVLRNFVKIKRLVTVCVSKNSILEKSCFGMSSYIWSLLHNRPMTVKKSSNLTIFLTIFGH